MNELESQSRISHLARKVGWTDGCVGQEIRNECWKEEEQNCSPDKEEEYRACVLALMNSRLLQVMLGGGLLFSTVVFGSSECMLGRQARSKVAK